MAKRISLNGTWQLKIDPEESGLAENWAKSSLVDTVPLNVPGCVQQLDCFSEVYPPENDMRNSYCGSYFLEKTVSFPYLGSNHRYQLILGGVLPCCYVWVNGNYAGKHYQSACKVELDIAPFLNQNPENRITVAIVEQHVGLSTGMRFAGHDWSGIFSNSYIEIGSELRFKDIYVTTVGTKTALIKGILLNNGATHWSGDIQVYLNTKKATKFYNVPSSSEVEVNMELDVSGLPRWSPKTPNLHDLRVKLVDDFGIEEEIALKIGLRNISVEGNQICFDNKPQYFTGAGQEYYSPTICPLTDEKIIRRRYQALLDHGFRFFRCHTYVPTEEELSIADEMGIMLDVEFGLVSNFNKTTPFEEGIEMLKVFVKQTRWHPSLIIYCLGNEGSQLMVDSYVECNRAKIGYKVIKDNTTEQLAIIAFGMQGELSELPNDFETPHLWSDNFLWGYDGLTDIPWKTLEDTTGGKPCIIHEYGKFGVWPDISEENTYPESGSMPDFGRQSKEALSDLGLSCLDNKCIANSRKLSGICNRIILEEARRQSFVCGYALWTFFRRCDANAGLCNDMGDRYDQDPLVFKNGCNADVALLIDRGFQNRTMAYGMPEKIRFTISNYGNEDIIEATIHWELMEDEKRIIGHSVNGINMPLGKTDEVCEIRFSVCSKPSHSKMELKGVLQKGDRIISQNKWSFWFFNTSSNADLHTFLYVDDLTTEKLIKKALPDSYTLSSIDSVLIGCRSWRNQTVAETAMKKGETVVIADKFDVTIRQCYENGIKVLLIDDGRLPAHWIVPSLSEALGDRDTSRFYSSFRAGWDKGNLLTIIKDNGLITGFPQEEFCDLQYYDMVQGARSLDPGSLEKEFGEKPVKIIEAITKIQMNDAMENIVQDPNAIKEQLSKKHRNFFIREQVYLMQMRKNLAICTLRLTDNISGIALLKTIIQGLIRA